MSVTLRLRVADQLAALIAGQQDSSSPQYRRWLTPDEFEARFAPTPQEYGAVVDWLQGEGFVVRPKVNGARIDFSGTVKSVEASFGVRMNDYRHRGLPRWPTKIPRCSRPSFAIRWTSFE